MLFRSPEPPTALLVHLGSRGDAIDGEEEELLRLDDGEEVGDVGEHCKEDGLLRDAERGVVVVWVRAIVDDAVHVEVCDCAEASGVSPLVGIEATDRGHRILGCDSLE